MSKAENIEQHVQQHVYAQRNHGYAHRSPRILPRVKPRRKNLNRHKPQKPKCVGAETARSLLDIDHAEVVIEEERDKKRLRQQNQRETSRHCYQKHQA